MADFEYKSLNEQRPRYPDPSPSDAVLPGFTPPEESRLDRDISGSNIASPNFSAEENTSDASLADRGRDIAHQATDRAREIAERARDQFQQVAGDAKVKMNEFAGRASDMASQASEKFSRAKEEFVNERLPVMKAQARERIDDARRTARRAAHEADHRAREFPVETVLAAAGAGLALGVAMRAWRATRG